MRFWSNANATSRLLIMLLVAGAAAGVSVGAGAARYAALIGWDVAATTFLVSTWVGILPLSGEETAKRSQREDPSRPVVDLLLIFAGIASLVAVGFVLIEAGSQPARAKELLGGLAVLSVVLSWLLVHTLYTLAYARQYHSGEGGIDFNQKELPRYTDFAYLAFTIGMTFQVSDTDLKTSTIRSTALRHALLSYLFGAVILATTVNLIVGLANGGS
jgi:uncharacterized membrane protein